jgi:4-amino-4-deoxy-L-arabinose transferase-like glycosyltransferase
MARRTATAAPTWIVPALAVAIALAAFAMRAAHPPRIGDDAYITLRYARNRAHGQGFVYNPGERVLGTTTPLYTLLLVPGVSLFGSEGLPRYATQLNAFFGGLSAFSVFFIARKLGGRLAVSAAASLLFALSPVNDMYSIAGMEDRTVHLPPLERGFTTHRAAGRVGRVSDLPAVLTPPMA